MKRFLIVAIGAVVLSGTSVLAAELTLDDCINLALKNRESIIRARGAEDVARMGKWAALGAFLPNVNASYDYAHVDVNGVTGSSRGATLYAGIRIPDVVASVFDYSAASVDLAGARLDVIASEQDLIYAVKAAYYGYLADVQNVSILEEAVKRSEEQLKLIQSKFDLGSASKSDVLKQKVQYGNDRLELLKAQNGVSTAVSALAYTIGIDPRADWQFSTKYTVRAFDGSLDSAVAFGLTHQPGLLSLEKSLKSARIGYKTALTQYLPAIGVSASWSKDLPDHGPEVTTKSYGYGFSWNLFDGFRRESAVTRARVARNNALAGLANTRNKTVSDIKTAYLQINQLKEQKTVAEETVASATEDIKITQEKYNLGAATILDLLDAQVSLKRAEVSLIGVDFNLNLAIAILEKSMGKL
ncbi:MAG: TolC family protein [candidate division Zixibacteria bacterium]|nr:TolC family protein [candidate division Zixibacteria bacterium]